MIKPIVTSPLMLRMPSEPATPADAAHGQDLLDTLAAHTNECVGMAANMIGIRKRIIVVQDGARTLLMFNPAIVNRANAYTIEESCLSLEGSRPCTRYRSITVEYQDANFKPCTSRFTGFTAQIIQHEVDHCNGIVI